MENVFFEPKQKENVLKDATNQEPALEKTKADELKVAQQPIKPTKKSVSFDDATQGDTIATVKEAPTKKKKIQRAVERDESHVINAEEASEKLQEQCRQQ